MKRKLYRAFLLAVIGLIAAGSRPPDAAAASLDFCGFPTSGHNCNDTGALEYMCDYLCPGWISGTCETSTGTLTCWREPE